MHMNEGHDCGTDETGGTGGIQLIFHSNSNRWIKECAWKFCKEFIKDCLTNSSNSHKVMKLEPPKPLSISTVNLIEVFHGDRLHGIFVINIEIKRILIANEIFSGITALQHFTTDTSTLSQYHLVSPSKLPQFNIFLFRNTHTHHACSKLES